jgi:hypothetical protein
VWHALIQISGAWGTVSDLLFIWPTECHCAQPRMVQPILFILFRSHELGHFARRGSCSCAAFYLRDHAYVQSSVCSHIYFCTLRVWSLRCTSPSHIAPMQLHLQACVHTRIILRMHAGWLILFSVEPEGTLPSDCCWHLHQQIIIAMYKCTTFMTLLSKYYWLTTDPCR